MDNQATATLIGFLAAGAVFTVSFAAVIQVSLGHRDDSDNSRQADRSASAAGVADTLLGQPGSGWYSDSPCDANGILQPASFQPDGLERMGLAEETCALAHTDVRGRVANLSFQKMRNLQEAKQGGDATNDAVDYEEARHALQLDAVDLDFHIRSGPLLPNVEAALKAGYKDPYMRLLYVGDYSSSGSGGGPPPYVKGVVDQANQVVVWLNATNNGASSTIFDAFFEIELKDDKVAFTLHTKVLAAGQSGNLSFTLLKTADWQWKHQDKQWVDVEVHDKDTKLVDTTISLAAVTMTSGSTRVNSFAESEKLSTLLSGPSVNAKYYHEARDGKGRLVDFGDWTYRLIDGSGNVVRADVLATKKEGHIEHAFTAAASYRAELWNDALTVAGNWDYVNIAVAEPGPYGGASTFTPGPSVLPEVSYIDALVERFDAKVFASAYDHATVPYAAGGDVFPDIKDAMNDELPLVLKDSQGNPTLDQYTTLIVGSNVDHNVMTSQAAKATIKDWVYAGGTLIVLGSADQSVSWLQPIFHASLDSASGGIGTPDAGHPSLHVPNDLDYRAFNYSTEWQYSGDAGEKFTHVVTAGSEGDLMAVSRAGVFGDGRVLLSSWRPYNLTTNQGGTCQLPLDAGDPCQAAFLLHNLMTLTYSDLYLDYGPTIPESRPVGVQSGIAQVWHPDLHMTVELYLIVYVF